MSTTDQLEVKVCRVHSVDQTIKFINHMSTNIYLEYFGRLGKRLCRLHYTCHYLRSEEELYFFTGV